jgi:hypothetical protein
MLAFHVLWAEWSKKKRLSQRQYQGAEAKACHELNSYFETQLPAQDEVSKNGSMGQVKPINWAGTVANGENLWFCMQAFQNQSKWALCSVPTFYNGCPNLSIDACEERPSLGHHQAPSEKVGTTKHSK